MYVSNGSIAPARKVGLGHKEPERVASESYDEPMDAATGNQVADVRGVL
jgi:hypothetical protein